MVFIKDAKHCVVKFLENESLLHIPRSGLVHCSSPPNPINPLLLSINVCVGSDYGPPVTACLTNANLRQNYIIRKVTSIYDVLTPPTGDVWYP